MSNIQMLGNFGCYLDDDNVISFQVGDGPRASLLATDPLFHEFFGADSQDVQWQSIRGFQVCSRGYNNRKCEEIASDIKKNRLLPRLITKQVNMLYGHGPAVYKTAIADGKLKKEWVDCPEVTDWLDSWQERGLEAGYREVAKAIIKNYYYFRDFFVKWRFTRGKGCGALPVAGLEAMENNLCRLATTKKDVATDVVYYKDFRHIAVGRWGYGTSSFGIYPKFSLSEVDSYRFAAVSHHREKSVDEFYGVNETHAGTRSYIKGSNETADYINSFLRNSLAAKIHIVIPNAWLEAKRTQITKLCDENKRRKKEGDELLLYNDIEIGTEFKESLLIRYLQSELRKISGYLSGADNQGKAYATISFKNGQNEEERWKIETVDLKYKEYVEALIAYDKRADEVLLSSVGLDASISGVSKDGVISKSGADAYYNYLIYIMSLTSEDEICSEPFNMALQVNFPHLYRQGFRIGFYREVPARQEDVSPEDRLNQQQS
ncbi:hypothetical protein JN06_02334 [Bacteroides zoogleoformans]|uniref:Uncharacterized protein n=1 Tax=Bacteroides zoogleoformans TaxID=28119 RepID=A0ABM6T6L1_9BACE|nr:hypothetical protein [Bacteroides zoogleoformans]AVM52350.1 hypothetical protein C4H11_04785 [Bacteroides zoogleoformans]TWJ11242.1 hypothetical protein JN06_02334 [Bacteroides zoogleoformans]